MATGNTPRHEDTLAEWLRDAHAMEREMADWLENHLPWIAETYLRQGAEFAKA